MIPFNRPFFHPNTLNRFSESLANGNSKGDGPFTQECARILSELSGGGEVLLTTSCTHALEMATILLDLGPGDEVILPSFTFTSAATALLQFGVTPVFVDIDKDTKNIDCNKIEEAITSKTRAISFVNYAGLGADFRSLKTIASNNQIHLIEDNAHGLGGKHQGYTLGSVGDFATLSFHESKNMQCGEGGALIINNPKFVERATILREKGTNRTQFLLGDIQKYEWVDKGSSYLLSDLLAGVLLDQLMSFDEIQADRMRTWNFYKTSLQSWGTSNNVNLHFMPSESLHTAHMFYLELENEIKRDKLISELKSQGVVSVFHYQGLHKSPAGKRYGVSSGGFENTNLVETTLIRIPLYFGMTEKQKSHVANSIQAIKL